VVQINQKDIVGVENPKKSIISFFFLLLSRAVTKPNSLVDGAPGLKGRRPAFKAQGTYVFFATNNFVMIVCPKTKSFTC